MSALLPCKQPGEGKQIEQFVAVLKGYPLASTAEAWPADSEEAWMASRIFGNLAENANHGESRHEAQPEEGQSQADCI